MGEVIRFSVKGINGDTEFYSADSLSTLVEVMAGGCLDRTRIFCNGQLINKHMTLEHENVTNGSCIVIVKEKEITKQRRFDVRVSPLRRTIPSLRRGKGVRGSEMARINDIVWAGWELSGHHNQMLGFVMRKFERLNRSVVSTDPEHSVLTVLPAIRSDPLPVWFEEEERETGLEADVGEIRDESSFIQTSGKDLSNEPSDV
jgi:hypothetical protein